MTARGVTAGAVSDPPPCPDASSCWPPLRPSPAQASLNARSRVGDFGPFTLTEGTTVDGTGTPAAVVAFLAFP